MAGGINRSVIFSVINILPVFPVNSKGKNAEKFIDLSVHPVQELLLSYLSSVLWQI